MEQDTAKEDEGRQEKMERMARQAFFSMKKRNIVLKKAEGDRRAEKVKMLKAEKQVRKPTMVLKPTIRVKPKMVMKSTMRIKPKMVLNLRCRRRYVSIRKRISR